MKLQIVVDGLVMNAPSLLLIACPCLLITAASQQCEADAATHTVTIVSGIVLVAIAAAKLRRP